MQQDPFDELLSWPRDQEAVCRKIRQAHSPIKLILKTRDEIELLPLWIEWHADICGIENLVVLDHGSTDSNVLQIYKSWPDLTVCRYTGYMDVVHHRVAYKHLYDALGAASPYSALLDTDEFLTCAQDSSRHDRRAIKGFVEANAGAGIFPCTWLFNLRGSRTRFTMRGWDRFACGGGTLFGKPLVNASTVLYGDIILHNSFISQLRQETVVRNNLMLLHLNTYSWSRQVRVTLMKMTQNGVVPPGASVDDVLAMAERQQESSDAAALRLREFRQLVESKDQWLEPQPAGHTTLELMPDGSIQFWNERKRLEFQSMLDDPAYFFDLMQEWRKAAGKPAG